MLSVLTGNVGINGGIPACAKAPIPGVEWFSMLENPVKPRISGLTDRRYRSWRGMTATRDGV